MSSPSSAEVADLPEASSLSIHLDLLGGISGDMFVAAMIDALPGLAPLVMTNLALVRPGGAPLPACFEGMTGGLRALRFGAAPSAEGRSGYSISERGPGQKNSLAPVDHGPGTSHAVLRQTLGESMLPESARAQALALLDLLAEAEARVHGINIDQVHFHELGDWDSLMDLVAAGSIAAALAQARWTASAPPLGGGQVRSAHGMLPVPPPATAALLTGYPWRDDGIAGERVTPTGAAILRHLVPAARCAARRDTGRLRSVGCGAGTRSMPGIANMLRVLVFERDVAGMADTDEAVTVIEFDVDDMTGEEIAVAGDHLRASPDVIDVSIGTRSGKKGRPVADFRLLTRPAAVPAIARLCFTETSTLGVRMREEHRSILHRTEVTAVLAGDALRVKLAERPGNQRTAKAAHDDVAAEPGLDQRRRKGAAAVQRALDGDDQ